MKTFSDKLKIKDFVNNRPELQNSKKSVFKQKKNIADYIQRLINDDVLN